MFRVISVVVWTEFVFSCSFSFSFLKMKVTQKEPAGAGTQKGKEGKANGPGEQGRPAWDGRRQRLRGSLEMVIG